MTGPKRIQRKRTKGWRMPEGAVYVGRPGRWGNPFLLLKATDPAAAVTRYREWLLDGKHLTAGQMVEQVRRQLGGRDLACWCPLDRPCHADVLLELANGGAS